jgi:hypothetical protein
LSSLSFRLIKTRPKNERIDANAESSDLLKRVNHNVSMSIIPTLKSYGLDLQDGWTIAPALQRHDLLGSGLPSKACGCRWSRPYRELGISFLFVATTRGDIVMETEAICPWQSTDLNDRYERVDAAHSTKPDNTRRAQCWLTQLHHQSTYRKQNAPERDPEQINRPKEQGARNNKMIVVQSWPLPNVTPKNPDCRRCCFEASS